MVHIGTSAQARAPLTRARVLESAVVLADREGVARLSMRRLAAEVGYEVMSLYHHVPGKPDLLDGMVEVVAAEVDPPDPSRPWRAALGTSAVSAHRALLRHPWCGSLWASRPPGPVRLGLMERWLATLATSGLSQELAHHAYHAVSNHVVGYSLQEQASTVDGDLEAAARAFLEALPQSQFPHVAAHVRAHLGPTPPGRSFELVLDLLLDGLERHNR